MLTWCPDQLISGKMSSAGAGLARDETSQSRSRPDQEQRRDEDERGSPVVAHRMRIRAVGKNRANSEGGIGLPATAMRPGHRE